MKRIAILMLAGWPILTGAHPCPFEWNIEFAANTEIKGTNLTDFVTEFNEAVKKEPEGKITHAIIFESKPDTFRKVPEDSPFSNEMDVLIKRYVEVTTPLIKKGVLEYGTTPVEISFSAKFPVACMLATEFNREGMNYVEAKGGAHVTRPRSVLECRAYQVSAEFLGKERKWERGDWIPVGLQPVPYFFASDNEMMWRFQTFPDPEKDSVQVSILDGVTLFLPDKKVILAIETKEKHEEMTKSMQQRHYLEIPGSGDSEEARQSPARKPRPANGGKPSK